VRAELGLSTGELGGVLLVGAVGSLATVLVAGALVSRWGDRRSLVAAAWMYAAAAALLGLGPTVGSVALLTVGVVLMSMSFALGNVPLNVQTVVVERRMGRTVVPQFHAAFSVGSVVGSGVGALAAWTHLPLLVQFGLVSVLSLAWRLRYIPEAVLPHAVPTLPTADGARAASVDGPRSPAATAPPVRRRGGARESLRAWRDPRTLVLGVIVMAGALSEGTANTWLAIGVVDGLGRSEAAAAVVFGVFVAGMTASRLVGTAVIDRFGRDPVLLASVGAALAGLVGFALGPSLPTAAAGAAAWGLGSGLVIPIGMAAVTGGALGAAGRVAVVSAFASVANLAAPPLVGLAAESVGIRHAVLLVTVVMALGLLLSRHVREPHEVRALPDPPPVLDDQTVSAPTTRMAS
jgi:MFS family permease